MELRIYLFSLVSNNFQQHLSSVLYIEVTWDIININLIKIKGDVKDPLRA